MTPSLQTSGGIGARGLQTSGASPNLLLAKAEVRVSSLEFGGVQTLVTSPNLLLVKAEVQIGGVTDLSDVTELALS